MKRIRQKSVNLQINRENFELKYNDGRSISPVGTQKRKMKITLDNFDVNDWISSLKPVIKHPNLEELNEIIIFP